MVVNWYTYGLSQMLAIIPFDIHCNLHYLYGMSTDDLCTITHSSIYYIKLVNNLTG